MKAGAASIQALRANYGRVALVLAVGAVLLLAGCATMGGGKPAPVTVDQIVQMSKAKTPPQTIIKQISDSGTVYRLSASQLADLRQQGVSDEVIDYMQQTYIEAVRRDQSREDIRYWYWGADSFFYGGMPYGW